MSPAIAKLTPVDRGDGFFPAGAVQDGCDQIPALPALVHRAANRLALATSAAEVLEARQEAAFTYDTAKAAGRLARAKGAHDEVIAAVLRAQADALEIKSAAEVRLANEYEAAQERGEVQAHGGDRTSKVSDRSVAPAPTAADLGLSRKEIHEARLIRDAEQAEPGIVRRVVTERVERREEPTKAAVREAVIAAARGGLRGAPSPVRRNPNYEPDPAFDAVAKLAGACRDVTGVLAAHGVGFLLRGFLTPSMRERSLCDFEAARDHLTSILEAADAQ